MRARALPIDPLLPAVVTALRERACAVVRAEPGAGKTTRLPAALLDGRLADEKSIVVLEPRRIAARMAAEFVASERGRPLGGEVGYRVRFERRGNERTRLWFVTEGTFTRQLWHDPLLETTGIVVLDEFHERHLQGDVALAVVRELQRTVRPELKLVVMSATFDTAKVAAALGDCPVFTSEGRAHPVTITYMPAPDGHARLAPRIAAAVRRALDGHDPTDPPGDVLVFLPGAAEIRRTAEAVEPLAMARGIDVLALHGTLPLDTQRRALQCGPRRRIVLATNVAETALTVEGVTTVVDSGLARVARLDARHGINTLAVVPISRASADQRAGRAGRIAPGRCIRLWNEAEHAGRRAHETPEILRLDLSALALELRGWGLEDARALPWLDPPPPAALAAAERLLVDLGAVRERDGTLTAAGTTMLSLPVPPRIARVLVEARRRGCIEDATIIAALASERDIYREWIEGRGIGPQRAARWPSGPSDLLLRRDLFVDATRRHLRHDELRRAGLDAGAVRAVAQARHQLAQALRSATDTQPGPAATRGTAGVGEPAPLAESGAFHGTSAADRDAEKHGIDLLRCILAGFPDRVCRRRSPGSPRAVMVGGRGVVLDEASVVRDAELFVAVDLESRPAAGAADARVRIASEVRSEWLAELFPGALREETEMIFDPDRERVVARTRTLYRDLVLRERVSLAVDAEEAAAALAAAALANLPSAVTVGPTEESLLARIRFLAEQVPDLGLPPDTGALLTEAVTALCAGRTSFAELRTANLGATLRQALSPAQRASLERDAPSHLTLPGGRRAPIVYAPGKAPAVAARIQELFGLTRTPRLARGRVALAIEILAPSRRPVQITTDLESFWRTTYAEVRKQLRARYPKHHWPEDPLTATPTSRPRRHRE
jgi:ATP-dependent helicase HrpB